MRRKPSTCMYHFDNDDWGEQGEYEADAQWEEQDDGYQEEYTNESYPTDAEPEDLEDPEDPEYEREDPDDENEVLEEDDQDTYE